MAVVARSRQGDHFLGEGATLMDGCLAAGLPVASACSGRGACGRCVITVLEGWEQLDPAQEHELQVLLRNEAAAQQRLSCQCPAPAASTDLLFTTDYW